jgi:hypothetical protein
VGKKSQERRTGVGFFVQVNNMGVCFAKMMARYLNCTRGSTFLWVLVWDTEVLQILLLSRDLIDFV